MIERSDTEEVDALPVLAPEPKPLALTPRSVAPAVQTAAVAAGGFVAGAVVVGVLGRRHQRALAGRAPRRVARRKQPARELLEIVSSRSLLVDVHLLGSPVRGR
ncbi:MAG TPA: hypothetical protein VGY30_07020 [Solirubrobacteraceae bacterium]|jgi:hypothetical protein|nr:hypothetical protein [Solirubrobacteraceae bacterium]